MNQEKVYRDTSELEDQERDRIFKKVLSQGSENINTPRNTLQDITVLILIIAFSILAAYIIVEITSALITGITVGISVLSALTVIWLVVSVIKNQSKNKSEEVLISLLRDENNEYFKEILSELKTSSSDVVKNSYNQYHYYGEAPDNIQSITSDFEAELGLGETEIYIGYKTLEVKFLVDYLRNFEELYLFVYGISQKKFFHNWREKKENSSFKKDDFIQAVRNYLKSNPNDILQLHYISTGQSIKIKAGTAWYPKVKSEDGDVVVYFHPKVIPVILAIIILAKVYSYSSEEYKKHLEIEKLEHEVSQIYEKKFINEGQYDDSIDAINAFKLAIENMTEQELLEFKKVLKEAENLAIFNDNIEKIMPKYNLKPKGILRRREEE